MTSTAAPSRSSTKPALQIVREDSDPAEALQVSPKRTGFQNALIDAERGFSQGLKASSVLYVYFFIGVVVLLCGLLLQFHWLQWSIATMALSFAVTAELFQLLLRRITERLAALDPTFRAGQWRIAAAGVFVARTGALLVIGTALALHIGRLF